MSATLADNSRLSEFREKAKICFLDPSPHSEQIRWGFFANNWYNEFYDYALDIADENLFDLSAILQESIKFNRTVTVFVVILSVVAGFLVGFLMVRRRKRDILLMRMVGESNARVYVGFALEQMICIILGIAIGGAYYMWNPMDKLAIFAIAYFVALSFALVIFMSKKLIKNVKEDE
jgi:ABC-type antimicrobial peptide transport system permease subunit